VAQIEAAGRRALRLRHHVTLGRHGRHVRHVGERGRVRPVVGGPPPLLAGLGARGVQQLLRARLREIFKLDFRA
jgi:hypothetical protein